MMVQKNQVTAVFHINLFVCRQRIRDAVVGEEGFIWLLTDSAKIVGLTRAIFDMKDKTNKVAAKPATGKTGIR